MTGPCAAYLLAGPTLKLAIPIIIGIIVAMAIVMVTAIVVLILLFLSIPPAVCSLLPSPLGLFPAFSQSRAPRQGSGDELRLRLRPVTGPLGS
jgi:hypothetical protein